VLGREGVSLSSIVKVEREVLPQMPFFSLEILKPSSQSSQIFLIVVFFPPQSRHDFNFFTIADMSSPSEITR
jgi:hypothetical protein